MPMVPRSKTSSATRPRSSLADRLLRVILGCYFGVALVVTAGQMLTEYRSAHRHLEADIQTMQRTFGRGLADALWNFNTGVLHGILNGIAEMPVVVGVEVQDEHGRIVDRVGDPDASNHRRSIVDNPFERGFDLVYIDENHQPHPVGRWTVRSNDGIAFDQVKDTLVVILINSILKTIALWVIFRVVVHRMVGKPLIQIGTFLTQLDAGNLGSRPLVLQSRGNHELHRLAQVFNTMAARLRRAFDENSALLEDLKQANATLQARVEERTRDLARLALTDQLTGLSNRRALDQNLARELSRMRDGSRLSLILMDLDHFKSINDRHGHAVGDAVLVAVSQILRDTLRAQDILGRWGGEEFMILCPDTELATACALAEEMRIRVAATDMPPAGRRTCSFGVAERDMREDVNALLTRADAALYAAKRNGRDRVEAAQDSLAA